MTQQTSPFLEGKYGWAVGESGWNFGMDENLLKFSYLFDKNIDGVVSSLPAATNGTAYFLTTDNRLYFAVDNIYYSAPTPKWFTVTLRSTGAAYQFDGSVMNLIDTPVQLDSRLDVVELSVTALGNRVSLTNRVVANLSDLKSVDTSVSAWVYREGYYIAGDGGHSFWRYDAASSAAANDVTVVAPNAGPGRWLLNDNGVISVKLAGAKGDGTTNDTSSIASAILVAAGKTLYIPAGRYIHTGLSISNCSMSIEGDGPDLSVLVYTGTGTSLAYSSNDILNSFSIRNITFDAGHASVQSGLALSAFWPTATSYSGKTLTLENIEISSNITGGTYPCWQAGIYLKNAWNAKINQCYIRGQANATASLYGLKLGENCTGVKIESTNIIWFSDALVVEAYLEGLIIENSDFTDCVYGVRNTNTATGILQCSITDTHLNCHTRCVLLTKCDQFFMTGCLSYITNTLAAPAHVEMVNSLFPRITSSHFNGGSIALAASVSLNGCAYGLVVGNTFDNLQASPAVWFQATTSNSHAGKNIAVASNTLVNQYLDQGTGNYSDTHMGNAQVPGKNVSYDFGSASFRWRTLYSGGSVVAASRKSSAYTLTAADRIVTVDTGGGNVTITLPASPTNGQKFTVYKEFAANTLTVSGGSNNIDNIGTSIALTAVNASARLAFVTGYGWIRE